jgi:hypothetical protein
MIALTKTDKLTSAEPGTWSSHEVDGNRVVVMSCPSCGKLGGLGDHKVNEKGLVTPSVVCPNEGCGFHDMVKLLGWNA